MLGAAAYGLHRGPHVLVFRKQIPTRGLELRGVDAPAIVCPLWCAFGAIIKYRFPCKIAIPFDDGVRAPEFECFVRVKRRVNASKDHPGSTLAEEAAD